MSVGGSQVGASNPVVSALVVNDSDGVADRLRSRFPHWKVDVAASYLSAIGLLSDGPVDVVFACIDVGADEPEKAVAGLREAAGKGVRLLLCCRAEAEPLARQAMTAGADDYLICPLRDREIDAALASRLSDEKQGEVMDRVKSAEMSGAEWTALADLIGRFDEPADEFLKALAELLRGAFGAASAGVVVDGTAATSGAAMSEPELTEPLKNGSKSIGQVAIGPAETGDYGAGDRVKLQHYARLIGNLVTTAALHRELHTLAYTDELTKLPNRRYLLEFLRRLLAEADDKGSTVTLLMFDVDFFKQYNDQYGHDAGDDILKACGELFRMNCREHDVVTRYGGDEFAVVFWDKDGTRQPGSQHPSDVLPIVERCRISLGKRHFGRFNMPEGSKLTISGGLASYPQDATNVADLITRSDEALLRAKRDGKNRIFLVRDDENGGQVLGEEQSKASPAQDT